MSQTLTLELSDEVYTAVERQAQAAGRSPARVAAASLERHFGEISLGYATGADNESIDADLSREYSSTPEEP